MRPPHRLARLVLPAWLLVLGLAACSSAPPVPADWATADPVPATSPGTGDYATVRSGFLREIEIVTATYLRAERSPWRSIRKAVATGGAFLGLGGTVASLIVKDPDTRASVAQGAAGVAAVSGIVSLLPLGELPPGGSAVPRALELEIDRFRARWPEEPDGDLSPEEWAAFHEEMAHIKRLAASLAR